jgi:predicted NBD/HSP70 family sugar kinase
MTGLQGLISRAKHGDCIYLYDVNKLFEENGSNIFCVLALSGGGERSFKIGLPEPQDEEEAAFIRKYFYARIYNILSMLGGRYMTVYTAGNRFAHELAASLENVFGVHSSRDERSGYAKCLNVTDRINAALGVEPFCFQVTKEAWASAGAAEEEPASADITAAFQHAVTQASKGLICGMDVGGTDIKVVGAKHGHIDHIKEYDWFPAAFTEIDSIVDTVMLMARLSRALMALTPEVPPEVAEVRHEALRREATIEEIQQAVEQLESYIGKVTSLDGIGLSFPDVVIRDKIVGGETYKTKGVREHSTDYENEFKRLTGLNEKLASLCRMSGVVHITNDGPMAAYTAAVELAYSPQAAAVRAGMFAHTLGTELGTGWIDEEGEVPEYPLEVYNCIIDLGNVPAQVYPSDDVRSLNNFNTGIAGTLQKYTSQSGAFRLAEQYYRTFAPKLYDELFQKGYLTSEDDSSIAPTVEPVDMRKQFLEHLMAQAEAGIPEAERIFEEIGEYLAATWLETEAVLHPTAKTRVLYGRFVKRRRCFELMLLGARRILPDIVLSAADDELAFTPMMQELRGDPVYSVAQFGQALGAVYFAASVITE